MNEISKEYLYMECVLHRHCILLHLSKTIKWNNDVTNEIYMADMCLEEEEMKQMILNISNGINTYGMIKIKAFAGQEDFYHAKTVMVSTDNIIEIELRNS